MFTEHEDLLASLSSLNCNKEYWGCVNFSPWFLIWSWGVKEWAIVAGDEGTSFGVTLRYYTWYSVQDFGSANPSSLCHYWDMVARHLDKSVPGVRHWFGPYIQEMRDNSRHQWQKGSPICVHLLNGVNGESLWVDGRKKMNKDTIPDTRWMVRDDYDVFSCGEFPILPSYYTFLGQPGVIGWKWDIDDRPPGYLFEIFFSWYFERGSNWKWPLAKNSMSSNWLGENIT